MQTRFTLDGIKTLEAEAIDRIQSSPPDGGYYHGHSGGKDSITTYLLLEKAGVDFTSHHQLTTWDPPEAIKFLRSNYPKVKIDYPEMSGWALVRKKKFPPTRQVRYCCDILKERGGFGHTVVMGVRWAESNKRKDRPVIQYDYGGSQSKQAINDRQQFYSLTDQHDKRRMIEACPTKAKHILNPIIDWSDSDVWGFIKSNGIDYCELYDEGFTRIGCIGCPMAKLKSRKMEFERWPQYARRHIAILDDIVNNGPYSIYETGEEAFDDWLNLGHISRDRPEAPA